MGKPNVLIALFPFFGILWTPGSIGTLWTMAGRSPVPLASVAKEDVFTECFLEL